MKRLTAFLALAAVLAILPLASRGGTLSTGVVGMFPKGVGEFAYADLKTARGLKWFPQFRDQMLPPRFRDFEKFLASAGIDPDSQVDEMAWAAIPATPSTAEQLVGVALGQFNPDSAAAYFKQQKLPVIDSRGYQLFAFGSGSGPGDIFFTFLDSNTAAFGHRAALEKLIEVRFGAAEGLWQNERLSPLVNEANGSGVIWAVLNKQYTQLAFRQLMPESSQFPQAAALIQKISAMIINVQASSGVDARFQAVCASPDDANTLGALMQAGLLLQRYQQQQQNPDLASVLGSASVTPSGDRLNIKLSASDDQVLSLIRHNTFVFPAQTGGAAGR